MEGLVDGLVLGLDDGDALGLVDGEVLGLDDGDEPPPAAGLRASMTPAILFAEPAAIEIVMVPDAPAAVLMPS